MCFGQIDNVNVISYSRTIGCRVIVTENGQLFANSRCGLGHERDQVLWNPEGQLPDQGTLMGTNRVEITQCDHIEIFGLRDVLQDLLANLLGVPIGRLRFLDRRVLRDWELIGLSVNRA